MSGERDLGRLLRRMEPVLEEGVYVFALADSDTGVDALCRFREREGVSLIVRREEAERLGLTHAYPCRKITLNVHSSLDAVGFLAAVAARLADEGISANVVSAWHHDHLFVASADAARAVAALVALSDSQPE